MSITQPDPEKILGCIGKSVAESLETMGGKLPHHSRAWVSVPVFTALVKVVSEHCKKAGPIQTAFTVNELKRGVLPVGIMLRDHEGREAVAHVSVRQMAKLTDERVIVACWENSISGKKPNR